MSTRAVDMISDLKDLAGKTVKFAAEVDDDVCIAFTDGKMVRLTIHGENSVDTGSHPLSRYSIGRGGEREKAALVGFGVCTAEEWEVGVEEIKRRIVENKRSQLEQLKKELGES